MTTIVRSVDIAMPPDHVQEQWDRLDRLPLQLGHVVSVETVDEETSRWTVKVAGEVRRFEARRTEHVPGVRTAWTSAGPPPHAGSVDFHRLQGGRTRVTVQLEWTPQGLFDMVGASTGMVARAVAHDLEGFRAHVEGAGATSVPPKDAIGSSKRAAGTDGAPGRGAESPADIPPKGWLQVLERTKEQLKSDNVPVVAGGVAYFSFLALVPALAAIVSIYGLVAEPGDVGRQLDSLFGALPEDAAELLQRQVRDITDQAGGGLGLAAVVGVLASLWSASKGMSALVTALNIAYDEEESRKGLRLKLLTLGMTVSAVLGVTAVIAGMIGLGALASALGGIGELTISILRWPLLFALFVLGLSVLYRYAPDRDEPDWRWVSPGAALAAFLVVAGSFGFAFYVNNFGSYSETYGTLGAIVVLLLWLNLTAYVLVLGAELDAELERQTEKDTTKGRDEPLGQRGAYAADTVAA